MSHLPPRSRSLALLSSRASLVTPLALVGVLIGACGGSSGGSGGAPGTTGGASMTGGSGMTGGAAATGGASMTGGSGMSGGANTTGGAAVTGGASAGGKGGGASAGGKGGGTGPGTGGAATGGAGGASGAKFSFFITSLKALLAKSGTSKPEGFGGDFTYGETGPGAGLRGADKICAAIAEDAMAGAGKKPWRAFLSASKDENGKQVDAIDRIGEGPWYDRLGRIVAMSKADLLSDRPKGAHTAIINDLPNEEGVPNHRPDPALEQVDNHHMLTGTSTQGKLQAANATCLDWTSNKGDKSEGQPRAGLAWPRTAGGTGASGNWMSAVNAPGCAPGVRIAEMGGPQPNDNTVGNGGGYGGFYCFSMVP